MFHKNMGYQISHVFRKEFECLLVMKQQDVSDMNIWNGKHGLARQINPLNAELNPICHLLALLGAHLTLHVSRIRVKNRFYDAVNSNVCILIRIYPTYTYTCITNKMQRYTVYFIWELLYIFRVVPSPIIRSANDCIYNIWYLSHCNG